VEGRCLVPPMVLSKHMRGGNEKDCDNFRIADLGMRFKSATPRRVISLSCNVWYSALHVQNIITILIHHLFNKLC
jgi:hypothetical protein